jgi:hypothetical protein
MAHITSSAALQTNLLAGGSHTIAPGTYTLPSTALTLQFPGSLVATGPGVFISAGNAVSSWTQSGSNWIGTNAVTGMVWGIRDPTADIIVLQVARSPQRTGEDRIDRLTNFYLPQDQAPSIRTETTFGPNWPTTLVTPQNTTVPAVNQYAKVRTGADGKAGRVHKITAKNSTTGQLTLSSVVDGGWGPNARGAGAHVVYLNDSSFLTVSAQFACDESTGQLTVRPSTSSAFSTTKTVYAAARRTAALIVNSAWTFTDVTFCDLAMDPLGPLQTDGHFLNVTAAGCVFSRCNWHNIGAALKATASVTVQGGVVWHGFDASMITLATGADGSVVEGVTFYRCQWHADYGGAIVDVRAPNCTVRACDFDQFPGWAIAVAENAENNTSIEYNIFDDYGSHAKTGAVYVSRTTTSAYAQPATRPQVRYNYFRNGYGAQQFQTITNGSPANTLHTPFACFGVHLDNGVSHWQITNNIFENMSGAALHVGTGANIAFERNLVYGITSNKDYTTPWTNAADGNGSNYANLTYNAAFTSTFAASQTFFRYNGLHGATQPLWYLGNDGSGQTIGSNVTQHSLRASGDINGDPQIVRNQDGWIVGVASTSLLKSTSGINWTDPPVAQMGPGGWGYVGRVVNQSTTVTGPVTGAPLKWNPANVVPLVSPVTIDIPASTAGNLSDYTITLGASSDSSTSTSRSVTAKHAIIRLPTAEARNGPVRIEGTSGTNCRFHMIGGQIKQATNSEERCLNIAGIDHAYLEGVRLDKRHSVGSGIAVAAAGGGAGNGQVGMLWAQNVLITGINYSDTGDGDAETHHGDWFINQGGNSSTNGGLRANRCTFWTWNTGFILASALLQGVHFYDCNFRIYDSRYNPKPLNHPTWGAWGNSNNHGIFFASCTALTPYLFDNCYFWDDQPAGNFSITDSDGTTTHTKKNLSALFPQALDCDVITGDFFTGTIALNKTSGGTFDGFITGGIPPAGDFVDSGALQYGTVSTGPTHAGAFSGLNYQSPGYEGQQGGSTTTTQYESYFVVARPRATVSVLKIPGAAGPKLYTLTVQATGRGVALAPVLRATDTTFVPAPVDAVAEPSVFRLLNPPPGSTFPAPPSPAQQPELLTWDPDIVCRLTSPSTRNIATTGTISGGLALTAGEHCRIVLPSSVVNGQVWIRGVSGSGNRVHIIGGSIRYTAESGNNLTSCALLLDGIDLCFVEGLKVDKADTAGETIAIRGTPGGVTYLQNILTVGTNVRSTSVGHTFSLAGDALQIYAQARGLFVDKLTSYTWHQGFQCSSVFQNQYVAGASIINGAVIRRMNVHINARADNPITGLAAFGRFGFMLQNDCAALPTAYTLDAYTVANCYVTDDDPSGDELLALVIPGSDSATTCSGTYDDTTSTPSVYWGSDRLINGRVYYGAPPDGDYVASTFTGLSYTTPGYATVPGDTPPETATDNYGALTLAYNSTPTILEVLADAATAAGFPAPVPALDFPHTANPPHGVGYGDRWYDFPTQLVDLNAIPRFLWWNDRGFEPVTITVSVAPVESQIDAMATAGSAASVSIMITRAASPPIAHNRTAAVTARGVPTANVAEMHVPVNSLLVAHVAGTGIATESRNVTDVVQNYRLTVTAQGRGTATFSSQFGAGGGGSSVRRVYGTLAASRLGSRGVGLTNQRISIRFEAEQTAAITHVSFYNRRTASAGSGGTIRIALMANEPTASDTPSGTILSSATLTNAILSPYNVDLVRVEMSPAVLVQARGIYHLVFDNLAADRTTNYTSAGAMVYEFEDPPHPGLDVLYYAMLSGDDRSAYSTMTRSAGYQPIYNIEYSNGTTQSNPYTDVYSHLGSSASDTGIISGINQAKQVFTPTETMSVTHFGLRVGRISGSDSLSVRIANENGSEIETVTMTSAEVALENDFSAHGTDSHRWVTKALSATRTFQANTTYQFIISCAATSQYRVYPLYDGSVDNSAELGSRVAGYTQYSGSSTVAILDATFEATAISGITPTVTRAGVATRVDSSRLIAAVSADTARQDYEATTGLILGTLIEEPRTTLVGNTEAMNVNGSANAPWTVNAGVAPDGATTADLLVPNTTTAQHRTDHATVTADGTSSYAYSVFAKPSGIFNWVQLRYDDAATGIQHYADILNGVAGTASQRGDVFFVDSYASQWYRVGAARVVAAGAKTPRVNVATADNTNSFAGNASSGLLLWGLQLEAGYFPSSYIPNAGAAGTSVTRNGDVITYPVSSITGWNASAMTLVVAFRSAPDGASNTQQTLFQIDDGTEDNRIALVRDTSDFIRWQVTAGGVSQYNVEVGALGPQQRGTAALAVSSTLRRACFNGGSVDTEETTITMPSGLTTLRFGKNTTGEYLNGHFRRLKIYDVLLSEDDVNGDTVVP